jgi:hypothetical protein
VFLLPKNYGIILVNTKMVMEDYDYIARLWGEFKLIPKATLISARKYDEILAYSAAANLKVGMYKNGASQMAMKYKRTFKI